MGLDMYAYKTKKPIPQPVDFNTEGFEDREEINYWRKFNNLHGWMERLYRAKGGTEEGFNCTPVQLTQEDLESLKQDASYMRNLEPAQGFFFGYAMPLDRERQQDILEFVAEAEQAIADGWNVYYTSWW